MAKRRRKTLPKEWKWIRKIIPNYDPEKDKGDCWFDPERAQFAIDFIINGCTHVKGSLAGQAFILEPWQHAIVAILFGYVRPDGTRRFREALIYVPRKNGKTTLLAALVLLVMFTDDEIGAEIYSAAAEREQACLVYDQCRGMIYNNDAFDEAAKVYTATKAIVFPEQGTSYKALSADAKTKHGFNTHFAVVDELHAQPNSELVDVLMTSTGSRDQPMIVHITTADYSRESICNTKYNYAKGVIEGRVDDNRFFPVIYEAKKEDDWTSPAIWAKANPNLGISLKLDYMKAECERAKVEPSYENTFRRLHLNVQTEQADRWLSLEKWDNCAGDVPALDMPELLAGDDCWAGLDLSATTDITALVLYFPEKNVLLNYFWIPGDTMRRREKRSGVPWAAWARAGYVDVTDGDVVDYDYIRAKINELKTKFNIQGVGYDPWNATTLALTMQDQDGINMIEFRQGYASINAPSKELERMMIEGKLNHGGHPVLREMAAHVAIKSDPAGNIKPDKKKSTDRIDGIVAAVMAIGLNMRETVTQGSIYNTRGIRSV